jgi:hypothetical protein
MITTERMIGVQIRIFAKNGEELRQVIDRIQCSFYDQIRVMEKENNDVFQVHLVEPQKCSNCRKSFTDCRCGQPFKRPAV